MGVGAGVGAPGGLDARGGGAAKISAAAARAAAAHNPLPRVSVFSICGLRARHTKGLKRGQKR